MAAGVPENGCLMRAHRFPVSCAALEDANVAPASAHMVRSPASSSRVRMRTGYARCGPTRAYWVLRSVTALESTSHHVLGSILAVSAPFRGTRAAFFANRIVAAL